MIADDPNPAALAHHSTVVELVTTFHEAEREIRAAFVAIVEAERKLNLRFGVGSRTGQMQVHSSRYNHSDNFDRPDEAIEQLARRAWGTVIERLQIHKTMSCAAFATLEKQIQNETPPVFTLENVTAFGRQHAATVASSWEQKVVEAHEWLRPWRSEYKSNSQFEIGPRVVLGWCITSGGRRGPFNVEHTAEVRLLALEDVFRGLDGKGNVARHHYSDLSNAIKVSADGKGATEYFEFRCFRNLNLHVRFLRADLLAKFNATAAGNRLKPSKEAA